MSGRLLTKRKSAYDLTTDYTVPADKIFAGSVVVRGKNGEAANVSVGLKNTDITDVDQVRHYTPGNLPVSTYTPPSQAALQAAFEGAGGPNDSVIAGVTEHFNGVGVASSQGTFFITNDRKYASTDGGLTWRLAAGGGRWIPCMYQENSQLFEWRGDDNLHWIEDLATYGSTKNLVVSGLAADTVDDTYPIEMGTGSGTTYYHVFYGLGKRASSSAPIGVDTGLTLRDITSEISATDIDESYGFVYSSGDSYFVFRNPNTNTLTVHNWGSETVGSYSEQNTQNTDCKKLIYVSVNAASSWLVMPSVAAPRRMLLLPVTTAFAASYSYGPTTVDVTGMGTDSIETVYYDKSEAVFYIIGTSGSRYKGNGSYTNTSYSLVEDDTIELGAGEYEISQNNPTVRPQTLVSNGYMSDRAEASFAASIRYVPSVRTQIMSADSLEVAVEDTLLEAMIVEGALYNETDFTLVTNHHELTPSLAIPLDGYVEVKGMILSPNDQLIIHSDADVQIDISGLLQTSA